MKFIKEVGYWFTDEEVAMIKYMTRTVLRKKRHGRALYQSSKYDRALKYIKRHRVAMDIGAHVGTWSFPMSFHFDKIHSFEPSPTHAACYEKNLAGRKNVVLHQCALGNITGPVRLKCPDPSNTGVTMINRAGPEGVVVAMHTLDSFKFHDLTVDFVKIDCEGYELPILQGAKRSLLAWKPTIVVEQRDDTDLTTQFGFPRNGAVAYLKSLGFVVREDLDQDFVLTWK